MGKKFNPILGTVIHNLKVIDEYRIPAGQQQRHFVNCRCLLCGDTRELRADHFSAGKYNNCGCSPHVNNTIDR